MKPHKSSDSTFIVTIVHTSIFPFHFLISISIAPRIYVLFSLFVVNADEIKFRFQFAHVSAQQQKRPWTHRWTDLFPCFFQICLLILSNKCVQILLCSLNVNVRVFYSNRWTINCTLIWFAAVAPSSLKSAHTGISSSLTVDGVEF